jgi:hypothetical protein
VSCVEAGVRAENGVSLDMAAVDDIVRSSRDDRRQKAARWPPIRS